MQASSLSRTSDTSRDEQAGNLEETTTEISRQNRTETPEPANDIHADGGCCGGCGG